MKHRIPARIEFTVLTDSEHRLAMLTHEKEYPQSSIREQPSGVRIRAVASLMLLVAFAVGDSARASDLEFFEERIRPILAEHCYSCHSHNPETEPEAGLLLDFRAGHLTGGDSGPAVVPGKPDDSLLIQAIRYTNPDVQMPPEQKLSDAQITDFEKWVKAGAPWPDEPKPTGTVKREAFDIEARKQSHWAWNSLRRHDLPAVKDTRFGHHSIDRFLQSAREESGVAVAGLAEKRKLIRRAYFDVLGLPPSPSQVDSFLGNASPNAFEEVVDELLESPHFGENWARRWMDVVRYAETCGHEFDYPIPGAFRYRDYLIRAYNEDVPHDRFLREHVAGDLLPDPRHHKTEGFNESVLGTGFWYLHEATHGPVDSLGDQAVRVDNQIDTVSKAFLGLTVACARCHDHKFDAISQADYYSMYGFLASSRRQEIPLDPGDRINKSYLSLAEAQTQLMRNEVSTELVEQLLDGAYELISAADFEEDEVLFDDFESGTYDKWSVEGTAFAEGPESLESKPGYQDVTGHGGKFYVNTHLVKGGDGPIGRLQSKAFNIAHPKIRFLINGGDYAGATCVNLVVDNKVVRTATGKRSNVFHPVEFDVREYIGGSAHLEIVDNTPQVWGQIGIDTIVFGGWDLSKLEEIASKRKLDPLLLQQWTECLAEAIDDASHSLHWYVRARREGQAQALAAIESEAKSWSAYFENATLFENFEQDEKWDKIGWAFGKRGPKLKGNDFGTGVIDSSTLSEELQGTIRSEDFVLEHDYIHIRLAAKNAKVRLIVDSYDLGKYNYLLFHSMFLAVNGGTEHSEIPISASDSALQWITMTSKDFRLHKGRRAYLEIVDPGSGFVAVDQIVFSHHSTPPSVIPASADVRAMLSGPQDELTKRFASSEKAKRLASALRTGVSEAVTKQIAQTLREKIPAPLLAQGITEGQGRDQEIFLRGNHKTAGTTAPRQFLVALSGKQGAIRGGSGRIEFADRMLSDARQFVARVQVNRVWMHLMGRGIVGTPNDFGYLGKRPTHPELLDHLALDYVASGWSNKTLIKQIMMSRSYQLSSDPVPANSTVDSDNQFYHRANVKRLSGEQIRDQMLVLSRSLDRTMFGPSTPVHLTPFMAGLGRPGATGPVDGAGRRSIYLEVRRNFLNPMFAVFDTPIPAGSKGIRSVSNVPAQALTMMNDPFVHQQAKLWAASLLINTELSDDERVAQAFQEAFSRLPNEQELKIAQRFLEGGEEDAAWENLCHILLNTKESIYTR